MTNGGDQPVGSGAARGPVTSAARALLGAEARPLAGGYSGETFLVGGAGEEAVLRLYLRDPERAAVDAALLSLVRDLVPVPRVLESRTQASPDTPAFILMERLPGIRLDLWLAEAGAEERQAAAVSVAAVLSRLSGMPFLRPGQFVGADLRVEPWTGSAAGVESWVQAHRGSGALARWSEEDFAALLDVAAEAQDLVDGVRRVCLCHSDFNPKNLLVDPESGTVTGLLDWEYAHAGSPYTDIGNLLRFESDEVFGGALASAFAAQAPGVPADLLDLARASDLVALVDLAARAGDHPIADRAHQVLLNTARCRNLSAGRPTFGLDVSGGAA
jgi:aminoglycoside phosphotransferase (APT) family kinase protein